MTVSRALYGLKTSPLLWYKEFTKTLTELRLEPAKDAPCLWKNDKLLVFFYVDNIVLLAKPAHTAALDDFERKLLRKYEIRSLGELSTFCGIQTHRNRSTRSTWLLQPAHVDKLRTKIRCQSSILNLLQLRFPLRNYFLQTSQRTKSI
jgi:hypothetical protein